MKKNIFPLTIGVLTLSLCIGYVALAAWSNPPIPVNPPSGNVAIPVNVGGDTQHKTGALGIGGVLGLSTLTKTTFSGVSTYENVANYYNGNTSTGIVLICIEDTPNIMLDAEINVQGYAGLGKYHVRGYTYTTGSVTWHAPAAAYSGSGNKHIVRFANKSNGDRCILLGTTSTNWGNYLHASVQRVTVGFGSNSGIGNWTISLVTTETGLQNIVTPTINSGQTVFGGTVVAPGYLYSSDERLKENIETITNPIEKIEQLRGIQFSFKEKESKEQTIGLLAQDVEKVFQELF